jgi:hypothetical protein
MISILDFLTEKKTVGQILYHALNRAMEEQFPEREFFKPKWEEMDKWEKPAWENAAMELLERAVNIPKQ